MMKIRQSGVLGQLKDLSPQSHAVLFASALLVWLSGVSPTWALEKETFTVGSWTGHADYTEDPEIFAHCYIMGEYESGIRVFMTLSDQGFGFGMIDPTWALPDGATYDFTLKVDRLWSRTAIGEALGPDMLFIELGNDNEAANAFRRGRLLIVDSAGQDFEFQLNGTSAAIFRLRQCYVDHSSSKSENPFESAERTVQKPSTAEPSAASNPSASPHGTDTTPFAEQRRTPAAEAPVPPSQAEYATIPLDLYSEIVQMSTNGAAKTSLSNSEWAAYEFKVDGQTGMTSYYFDQRLGGRNADQILQTWLDELGATCAKPASIPMPNDKDLSWGKARTNLHICRHPKGTVLSLVTMVTVRDFAQVFITIAPQDLGIEPSRIHNKVVSTLLEIMGP